MHVCTCICVNVDMCVCMYACVYAYINMCTVLYMDLFCVCVHIYVGAEGQCYSLKQGL